MALEEVNKVDFAGIEKDSGLAVLTIADDWDWDDVHEHLIKLQAKFSKYLDFIESGEIWTSYPAAVNRKIAIDVISRFPPPPIAFEFLEKATEYAKQIGVIVRQETYGDSQ